MRFSTVRQQYPTPLGPSRSRATGLSDRAGKGAVEFRLLGQVEVGTDSGPVPIGGPKPRALLATLLLERGQPVYVETLVEAIWGERAPATARALVQTYVSGLRRVLQRHGAADCIVTTAWGYRADVPAEAVDHEVFGRLLTDGRGAAADERHEDAAYLLGRAVEMWRGPALDGTDSTLLSRAAARLDELRLDAVEGLTAALLALDRLEGLADRLAMLVAQHPFRERLRAHLMATLHRQGRRADALTVFREGRGLLIEELGVEPGAELSALHLAMLREEAALEAPATPAQPAPAQLPACPIDFTGREAELDMIIATLTAASPRPGLRIHVVTGSGGVGKSTLAVQAAHALVSEFPDGQLYVDLLGLEDAPAEPGAVLGSFLRALGADPARLPATVSERAAQFRSMLAGRRVLLVLDDAAGVAQLAPLLPGSPTCAVLITSRDRIGGLPGADRTHLEVLPEPAAIALLGRIIGTDRVDAAPEAARRLVIACDRMPLAIRVAGARLATRPGRSLRMLADRVADERRRLDELSDGSWGVRVSLDQSFRRLDPPARDALRTLGTVRLTHVSTRQLGSLLGMSEAAADAIAARLADAHLLRYDREGYQLPGLVRLFAAEQAAGRRLRPALAAAGF